MLDRVTKKYGKKGLALDRVSLHIAPKEFVLIVGTSGAGKSTLLKLLTREEKPTSGKIVVGGIDYDRLKDKEVPLLRRKIGTIYQDFKLLPNRTVFENIAFALEIVGMTNKEISYTVPRVIDLVGLTGKEKNFPRELSGGEQQRVAIARASSHDPLLILADEPTGNLDEDTGETVLSLLLELTRGAGKTLFMATHAPEVAQMADRVLHLVHGKLVSDQVWRQEHVDLPASASAPSPLRSAGGA